MVVKLGPASLNLAVAAQLAGCVTTGGSPEARVSTNAKVERVLEESGPFTTDHDFRAWFAFYYRNPHPERMTDALTYMTEHKYLEEFPDIAAVFVAHVMLGHPDRIAAWCEEWRPMAPGTWEVILVALWFVDSDHTRQLFAVNVGRAGAASQERLAALARDEGSRLELWQGEVTEPRQINLLWAAFSATGDVRFVQKVIDSVYLYGVDGPPPGGAIGEAAIMTLANNAMQHDVVARLSAEARAQHPNPRTRLLLDAMLSALSHLKKDDPDAGVPAH